MNRNLEFCSYVYENKKLYFIIKTSFFTYGMTVQLGIRFIINFAATSAFDLPISALLKKIKLF